MTGQIIGLYLVHQLLMRRHFVAESRTADLLHNASCESFEFISFVCHCFLFYVRSLTHCGRLVNVLLRRPKIGGAFQWSQLFLDGANTEPVRTVVAELRIDAARTEVQVVSVALRVSGREPHRTARTNVEERTIRVVPIPRRREEYAHSVA